MPRTVPLCFSLLYMFFVSFLEQCFAGRRFYSNENASSQISAVQEDDKFAAYSISLFSLLYMSFVSFLEQFIAGKPFYSKENAPPQNFAVQEDHKFVQYLFVFPSCTCFCVFSLAVYCYEALLQ